MSDNIGNAGRISVQVGSGDKICSRCRGGERVGNSNRRGRLGLAGPVRARGDQTDSSPRLDRLRSGA